ncbi:MAG: GNAT family N-acetyltransferase [Clostridia bacterium]|nr:GNAT family N-acetyltransferase [Clostridia bacterium]
MSIISREIVIGGPKGVIRVTGPALSEEIASLSMDETLDSFRKPQDQKKALEEIAMLVEGRVYIAVKEDMLIGYVTFHPPEKFERWGRGGLDCIRELGAIEVSRNFRGMKLALTLMELSFCCGAMDDYIVIATEYYWHWDLKGTNLSTWEYRRMLEAVMSSVGMRPRETDESEISSHPANVLMVRIGKNVSKEDSEAFERLLIKKKEIEYSN